jgi:hypothetical protein
MRRSILIALAAISLFSSSLLPAHAYEDTKWGCIWSGGVWVTNGFGGAGFCYQTLSPMKKLGHNNLSRAHK